MYHFKETKKLEDEFYAKFLSMIGGRFAGKEIKGFQIVHDNLPPHQQTLWIDFVHGQMENTKSEILLNTATKILIERFSNKTIAEIAEMTPLKEEGLNKLKEHVNSLYYDFAPNPTHLPPLLFNSEKFENLERYLISFHDLCSEYMKISIKDFLIHFNEDYNINSNKIIWQGSIPEITNFIDQLKLYDILITKEPWKTTTDHFVNKKGGEIKQKKLSTYKSDTSIEAYPKIKDLINKIRSL